MSMSIADLETKTVIELRDIARELDLAGYTALKKQHVAAKFIRYPGNYHGGWPPWDVVHRYYQETGWWQEHLD